MHYLRNCRKRQPTERSAEIHTAHNDFVVRDGESLEHFFTATGELGAHLYSTSKSHLCVHCSNARKELLKWTFLMDEEEYAFS